MMVIQIRTMIMMMMKSLRSKMYTLLCRRPYLALALAIPLDNFCIAMMGYHTCTYRCLMLKKTLQQLI